MCEPLRHSDFMLYERDKNTLVEIHENNLWKKKKSKLLNSLTIIILIDVSGVKNSIKWWSIQWNKSHNSLQVNSCSQKCHKDNFLREGNEHLTNKLSTYLENNCITWLSASMFFTALAVVLQPPNFSAFERGPHLTKLPFTMVLNLLQVYPTTMMNMCLERNKRRNDNISTTCVRVRIYLKERVCESLTCPWARLKAHEIK